MSKWDVRRYSRDTLTPKSMSPVETWQSGPSVRPPELAAAPCCGESRWPRRPLLPDKECNSPAFASHRGAPGAQLGSSRRAYRIQPAGRRFLRVQAYQSPAFAAALGVILAAGSNILISFMGIMGRKRTKSKKSDVNSPSVPTKVM